MNRLNLKAIRFYRMAFYFSPIFWN